MRKAKTILKYILYGFLVFIVSLCCYVFVCLDILHKDYVNIFGYTYFVVVSGSMTGEIEVNDIVVVDITKDVKIDDIIAYKSDKSIVTHRLVQKTGDKYITKGDANDTYDKEITSKDIIGKIVLIISPKFLLECVILIFIIIVALALLNFDEIFKRLFKVEDKKIVREHKDVLPQDIFGSPEDKNKDKNKHSGLTITIPLDELEDLKKNLEKDQSEEEKNVELSSQKFKFLDLEEDDIYDVSNDKKQQEDEIYNIVDVVLKVHNGNLDTTRLTKEWQKKYKYIYKLCLFVQSGRYDLLDKELNDTPFKEYFDYDIDKVGLYKELRNKIYDLPIYVFLKILFIAILYNDEYFFDGVFKIMKYKVLVDKYNNFVELKGKYEKRQLKNLINFMERVSKKYSDGNKLELSREKKLVDINNY